MQKLSRYTWLLLPALLFLECADAPVTPAPPFEGPPVTPTLPFEFDYPLSPETRWWYSYYYLAQTVRGYSWTHGNQVWEVAQASPPATVTITVSRIDTLFHIENAETTMVNVTESQTSFLASIDADKRTVRWLQLTHWPVGVWADVFSTVPRYVESLSDTLTIEWRPSTDRRARAKYLSGIGLFSWDISYFQHYSSFSERLVLDSLIVR